VEIEDKLNLSEDRGQISKIEDSPLKNQADGRPTHASTTELSVATQNLGKISI